MFALAPTLVIAAVHGVAVPLLWIIGLVLIIAGIVALFRSSILMGIVLIVLGIVFGGLNVI
jgi:hypothetical protein